MGKDFIVKWAKGAGNMTEMQQLRGKEKREVVKAQNTTKVLK